MNFKEPSTWGGLGVMCATAAGFIPADFTAFGVGGNEYRVVCGILAFLCAVAAVAMKERGSSEGSPSA